ncbi:ankyrin [Apiospora sp. TS-2023a]
MPSISFKGDPDIDPQFSSVLARLPSEIHLAIAMESESDETVFGMLRTCKMLFGVYRDYLYERNIRHDNGSAVFKIARNGEVAAFEHLERIAKTMDEGLPGLSRVEFVLPGGKRLITGSLVDRPSCPLTPRFSFTPLHWAAAEGHLHAVHWLLTKGASCNALGKSLQNRFRPDSMCKSRLSWRTHETCTPLHVAMCAGDLEVSICLLGAGSVIDVENPAANSQDILNIALIYGHVNLIRYLIQNNYASLTRNHLHCTAESRMCTISLHCLAELGCDIFHGLEHLIRLQKYDTEALGILQEPAIHLDLSRIGDSDPSTNQATALLEACLKRGTLDTSTREDYRKMVVLLIESGADVNYPFKHPWFREGYLLDQAMTLVNDDGSIVEELIKGGAQVRKPNDELSSIDKYLERMVWEGEDHFLDDLEATRADGSSVAVYKLDLLLKHGAGIPKRLLDDVDLLENIYTAGRYTRDRRRYHERQEGRRPANLPAFLNLLVDNGMSIEPRRNHDWDSIPRSYLFRALIEGDYDIARVFIHRGGTCFDALDRMEDIDECYPQMSQDIRRWIDTAYFL